MSPTLLIELIDRMALEISVEAKDYGASMRAIREDAQTIRNLCKELLESLPAHKEPEEYAKMIIDQRTREKAEIEERILLDEQRSYNESKRR